MNREIIRKYAHLVATVGCNIQKGEQLVISTTFDGLELAKELAKCAYELGAIKVDFIIENEELTKIKYQNESKETLTTIDSWRTIQRENMVDNKVCYVAILSEDPNAFEDIPASLLAEISRARHNAFKRFYDAITSNYLRWCLCAVPNKKWAKTVFPDLCSRQAVRKLWELIVKTMRLDALNPTQKWLEHIQKLESRSKFMTDSNFVSLTYSNSIGTDLTIGLPKGYYFSGGHENSKDGIGFTANMPTEEIFTLPNAYSANGKIVASMPLVHNGSVVKDFWLQLQDGRIIDYGAKQGYDILKGIIESDEGSHYLGEIALVEYNSPIQNLNTLFYNTLFDENASCHFAIGEAYPMIKNIDQMTTEQIKSLGVNKSSQHVDFMIGTSDLNIVATKENGEKVDIFINGNFVI